jgi:hypothetical protein
MKFIKGFVLFFDSFQRYSQLYHPNIIQLKSSYKKEIMDSYKKNKLIRKIYDII